jgi:ParB family transcriptional regulator, chromosome partitioning protein
MNRKKTTILPVNRTKLKNVALFEEEKEVKSSLPSVISLQQIILPKSQARRYFDSEKLERLTQSVKEHGILEPLLIRPLANTQYELVAGERRYRAAQAAKLNFVPVVVKELDDTQALQLSLQENLQREDLNPFEETEGILQLLAIRLQKQTNEVVALLYQMQNVTAQKITDNVISNLEKETVEEVFAEVGRMNWESFTANRLPLLRLPEDILEVLRQGKIEYTKAKVLARIKEEKTRTELIELALAESLSLSKIRALVNESKPVKLEEKLKTRFDTTYKQAKKAKSLWSNAKKRKQLECLLTKLEKLIESEK